MAVVEQEALWERVQAGALMAAVDVYAPEPPPQMPGSGPPPRPADAAHGGRHHLLPPPLYRGACQDAIMVLTGGLPRYQANIRDDAINQGRAEPY
jgi:hypothetical protein